MRAPFFLAAAAACFLSGCVPGAFPGASSFEGLADAHGNTPPPTDELAKAQQDFRDRNFGLAEQLYRKIVEREPGNANAWLGLGSVHDELGRFDLADQDYAQVAKFSGASIALLNDRGYSFMLRGNYVEARTLLLQAQALDPQNLYVLRNIQLLNERAAGMEGSPAKLGSVNSARS